MIDLQEVYPSILLPHIADGEDKSCFLKNRIRKNYRKVRNWAKKHCTNCFRLYDREVPGYPLCIDFYDGRFHVQYFLKSDEEKPFPGFIQSTNHTLCELFGTGESDIYWKIHKKTKETRQYEKFDETGECFPVLEYGVKFLVNLNDYLDTGLFLDHRVTRKIVSDFSRGKKILNLFAYTSSFSVHAAKAGATFTKSVDMSNTYTAWSRENFLINNLSLDSNEIVRADCLKFLDQELSSRIKYDIIVIDPPTISRSKKMDQLFDVQVDYISLIKKAEKLLSPGGIIIFSTNSRKFVFDYTLFDNQIIDMSERNIPIDVHKKHIPRCWMIKTQNSG